MIVRQTQLLYAPKTLVEQRFPESDPVEKVPDWVEELGQTRVVGSNDQMRWAFEGFNDHHVLEPEKQLKGKSTTTVGVPNGEGLGNTTDEPAIKLVRSQEIFETRLCSSS